VRRAQPSAGGVGQFLSAERDVLIQVRRFVRGLAGHRLAFFDRLVQHVQVHGFVQLLFDLLPDDDVEGAAARQCPVMRLLGNDYLPADCRHARAL
jgi:hypothetical protein